MKSFIAALSLLLLSTAASAVSFIELNQTTCPGPTACPTVVGWYEADTSNATVQVDMDNRMIYVRGEVCAEGACAYLNDDVNMVRWNPTSGDFQGIKGGKYVSGLILRHPTVRGTTYFGGETLGYVVESGL